MQTIRPAAQRARWLFIGAGAGRSIRGRGHLRVLWKGLSTCQMYRHKLVGAIWRCCGAIRRRQKILVEIRNVHDKGEAWALRSHEIRDSDANRIFRGILNYAKRY